MQVLILSVWPDKWQVKTSIGIGIENLWCHIAGQTCSLVLGVRGACQVSLLVYLYLECLFMSLSLSLSLTPTSKSHWERIEWAPCEPSTLFTKPPDSIDLHEDCRLALKCPTIAIPNSTRELGVVCGVPSVVRKRPQSSDYNWVQLWDEEETI